MKFMYIYFKRFINDARHATYVAYRKGRDKSIVAVGLRSKNSLSRKYLSIRKRLF